MLNLKFQTEVQNDFMAFWKSGVFGLVGYLMICIESFLKVLEFCQSIKQEFTLVHIIFMGLCYKTLINILIFNEERSEKMPPLEFCWNMASQDVLWRNFMMTLIRFWAYSNSCQSIKVVCKKELNLSSGEFKDLTKRIYRPFKWQFCKREIETYNKINRSF